MRVLLVNAGDYGRGGGHIAMYRLHRGFRKAGVDSKLLCKYKQLESSESVAIPHSFLSSRLEPRLGQLTSRLGLNDIHCLSTFKIRGLRVYQEADLLDFHGIHSGYFNYLALPSLTAHKPAILTLHDMWHLTGHCMYSYDCERWKSGCGQCPYPEAYPPVQRDNTRLEWKLKNWVYKRSHITVVTPSAWLTTLAKQSMLGDLPIHHIPNGVDTDVYRPLDRGHCRSLLGIPVGKRVLLFSAMRMNVSSLDGSRKGGDLLVKALRSLPDSLKAETVLLLLGDGGEAITEAVGIPALNLGYVSSDQLKAIAYCAADLLVLPTRADNLPLGLLESMACGTPLVSFRVGGIPELVRPGITGYLAEPGDANDLSNGIIQLLEDEALRHDMSQRCRAIALKEYPLALQVQRYLELYSQVLANARHDVPGSVAPAVRSTTGDGHARQAVPRHLD
ncbi:MAG TPA: glycosyltransferase family 4 protein [Candidatus Tectomicrobia bacterium]